MYVPHCTRVTIVVLTVHVESTEPKSKWSQVECDLSSSQERVSTKRLVTRLCSRTSVNHLQTCLAGDRSAANPPHTVGIVFRNRRVHRFRRNSKNKSPPSVIAMPTSLFHPPLSGTVCNSALPLPPVVPSRRPFSPGRVNHVSGRSPCAAVLRTFLDRLLALCVSPPERDANAVAAVPRGFSSVIGPSDHRQRTAAVSPLPWSTSSRFD